MAEQRKRPAAKAAKGGQTKAPEGPVYQIRITLLHSEPEIWRRVLVSGDIDLGSLHRVIQ
jgi:hypothetical protein